MNADAVAAIEGPPDPLQTIATPPDSDRGPCLVLLRGRRFYPLDPRPEEVDFEDVAHQLSFIALGGTEFFSLAQHAALLADHLADQLPSELVSPANRLVALLQGAADAYLPELPLVAKSLGPRSGSLATTYQQARVAVQQAIFKAAGLPENPELIADGRFRKFLKDQLRRRKVSLGLQPPAANERCQALNCWIWRQAEREFLKRYYELSAAIKPGVVLDLAAGSATRRPT